MKGCAKTEHPMHAWCSHRDRRLAHVPAMIFGGSGKKQNIANAL